MTTHTSRRVLAGLGVLLSGGLLSCHGDVFVTSRGDVEKANKLLTSGESRPALEAYEALQLRNPRIAFDRGLALMELGEWDKAISAFDEARESDDPAMKAASYYHIGNVHTRKALAAEKTGDKEAAMGAWKDAVAAYENALILNPDHEGAKKQLEAALFRVDPPCRLRNDKNEPNDQFAQARVLELKEAEGPGAQGGAPPGAPPAGGHPAPGPAAPAATPGKPPAGSPPAAAEDEGPPPAPGERRGKVEIWLCPDDEDWYQVKLEAGDRLFVTFKRTSEGDHAAAAVEIWAPDGKKRLRPPEGSTTELESVSLEEVSEPGDYHIRVANPEGDDFGGTLSVAVRPECRRTEDSFEPNDTLSAAKDLKAGEMTPARLCPGNEDWYAVEVGEGESLKVTAQVQAQKGEAKLTLTDAQGTVLSEGKKGEKDSLTALAYGRPAGKVYLHVSGSLDAEAVYGLKPEVIPVCSKREDKEEENDTVGAAKDLAPGDHPGLQLCPNDPDFYKVAVKAGESIVAHLSPQETYHGTPTVDVVDTNGKELAKGFHLEGGVLAVLLDPGAGTYFLRVNSADAEPTDSKYDLTLRVLPACPEGNDDQEKNDSPTDAKPLEPAMTQAQPDPQAGQPGAPPGQGPAAQAGPLTGGQPPKPKPMLLRICPGDQDWFRIPVRPDTPLMMATIQFVHEKGDLDLVLYEKNGEDRAGESHTSSKEKNGEAVMVPPPEARIPDPTDYLLKVAGVDATTQNFYLLTLQPLPPQDPRQQNQQQKQQDQQKQDQQKQQKQEPKKNEKRPDRSAIEKEMENQDKNHKNLEAERAARQSRHLDQPLKDW